MRSRKDCNRAARAIENEIRRRFDWIVKVTVKQDGTFSWQSMRGRDRYDLYPGMTKAEADAAIVRDIEGILRRHLGSVQVTDYFQSGKMHYPTQ